MNRTAVAFTTMLALALPACSGGNLSSAAGGGGLVPSTAQSRTLAATSSRERGGHRRPRFNHIVPFENMYVANGGNGTVAIYSPGGVNGPTLLRTITAGISAPRSLAVDSQGNLYVANGANVTAYAKGSSAIGATFSTGLAQPNTVYVDASDYVYVSDNTNNVVQVYSPYFNHVVPYRTLSTGSRPHGIAVDGAGHVFVANYGSDSVTVFKPNSTAVLTTITAGIHGPTNLAITPDGDLVVSNSTGNNGNGSLTSYANGAWATLAGSDTTHTNSPQRICFDSNGNMFVPQKGSNVVNVYPNLDHVVPFVDHVVPFQVGNGMLSPSGCSIDDNQTTLGVGNTGGAQPDVELANLQQAAGGDLVQLPISITQSPADVVYGP